MLCEILLRYKRDIKMKVYLILTPINCAILFFFLKLIHRNTVFCKDSCHISDKNLRPKVHRQTVTVKNVFSLENVGLTKQRYAEQRDCTTQNSEAALHRTVRLCYTEQCDCTTQNSETALHRTVRLQYTEQ